MKQIFIVVIIAALALAACQQQAVGNTTNESVMSAPGGNVTPAPTPAEEPELSFDDMFTITKTEGDLIILSPEAIDPDGDAVDYSFSKPFAERGRWQTAFGDAGNYTVMVTATDTKGASTSTPIRVVVQRANRPPVLNCPEGLSAKEGERIRIDCRVTDAESDEVRLSYEGWMTDAEYTTTFQDAGTHEVTVTADDGRTKPVRETIEITVQDVNRAPTFALDLPSTISGEEGDVIAIDVSETSDPDGDPVSFTFSEPFDGKGVWRTEIGDAGTYPVDVVASDGTTTVKKTVTVILGMKNTAPVLKRIPDVTVYEGQTVKLDIAATDREGNDLTYTITGWMTRAEYVTTYDDAGTYTAKVTASDGQYSASQVVHITVLDRNRPPVFRVPA